MYGHFFLSYFFFLFLFVYTIMVIIEEYIFSVLCPWDRHSHPGRVI